MIAGGERRGPSRHNKILDNHRSTEIYAMTPTLELLTLLSQETTSEVLIDSVIPLIELEMTYAVHQARAVEAPSVISKIAEVQKILQPNCQSLWTAGHRPCGIGMISRHVGGNHILVTCSTETNPEETPLRGQKHENGALRPHHPQTINVSALPLKELLIMAENHIPVDRRYKIILANPRPLRTY